MSGDIPLTELQIATLRMFFDLPESTGFVLAGGAALLAQELTVRPTYDLDLILRARQGFCSCCRCRD